MTKSVIIHGVGEEPDWPFTPGAYPPDTTLTVVAQPSLSEPGYLTPYTDPSFGTEVMRISDKTAMGLSGNFLRHVYPKRQPWNADQSLIFLGHSQPHPLIDGMDYSHIRSLSPTGNNEVWSNTDPGLLYNQAISGNTLHSLNLTTGAITTVHTFTGYTSITIGNGEGNLSNDDRYMPIVGVSSTGGVIHVMCYDTVLDSVVGTLDTGTTTASQLDWAGMSQTGEYMVLHWQADGSGTRQGVKLYDTSMAFVRHLCNGSEHADVGLTDDNEDIFVTLDYSGTDKIVAYPMDGSSSFDLLTNTQTATHVSCRNIARPGWTYVSDSNAASGESNQKGWNEVYALKLDGSGTVERFAHVHQSSMPVEDSRSFAVPNQDGTKVMFASDWAGLGLGYSYVAGMSL